MPVLNNSLHPSYQPLTGRDSDSEESATLEKGFPVSISRGSNVVSFRAVVQFALCALVFSVLGFLAGNFTSGPSIRTQQQDQDIQSTFTYHQIYSQPPSSESNDAWLALFPRAHGFVQPPGYSDLSLLSVFHQLHCINVLRHGYYVALNSSYEEQSLKDITISKESIGKEHVVHCFDYLRQATQCFSDRTVEAVDVDRGGATGWGSVHQCRNHDRTLELANEWELHKSDASHGS